MAELLNRFDSAHVGPLHDIQVDYYNTKLATASSDRAIRIWDITSENPSFLAELRGHDGPVWQVCWAHPQFGCLLASCGYDKRIIVWQSQDGSDLNMPTRSSMNLNLINNRQLCQFTPIYINEEHAASVNGICFAPWELGLGIAACSTDGSVSICWHKSSNEWTKESFFAHFNGVNAVAWAPPAQSAGLLQSRNIKEVSDGYEKAVGKLLATGGCDNQVRIWAKNEQLQQWQEITKLNENGHTDWVRDVSFQPASLTSSLLIGTLLLASCSEDQTVKLWKGEAPFQCDESSKWRCIQTINLGVPVWKISWSFSGNILAAACGESNIILLRENLNGQWEKVSNISELGDPDCALFERNKYTKSSPLNELSSTQSPPDQITAAIPQVQHQQPQQSHQQTQLLSQQQQSQLQFPLPQQQQLTQQSSPLYNNMYASNNISVNNTNQNFHQPGNQIFQQSSNQVFNLNPLNPAASPQQFSTTSNGASQTERKIGMSPFATKDLRGPISPLAFPPSSLPPFQGVPANASINPVVHTSFLNPHLPSMSPPTALPQMPSPPAMPSLSHHHPAISSFPNASPSSTLPPLSSSPSISPPNNPSHYTNLPPTNNFQNNQLYMQPRFK